MTDVIVRGKIGLMSEAISAQPASNLSPFASLRRRMEEQGLFRRQFGYYTLKSSEIIVMLVAGVLPLVLSTSMWVHAIDAVYMGFVFGQIGLLFHDAGHRQIFAASRRNDVIGYLCGLILGASLMAWMDTHNAHHAHPNHEDSDPDIAMPFFVFSETQAREANTRSAFARFIIRHQDYLYFPLVTLTAFSMRWTSWQFLIVNRQTLRKYWIDIACCSLHIILYLALVFMLLSPLHAILFIVIHQMVWGFYMGSVFAPNHKGMRIIGKDEVVDFVSEQVTTSRNIRGNPVTDFVYGGLNYQIEHHLFPHMPRKNLSKANAIVRDFCHQQGIDYYETSIPRSYVEIFHHMRSVKRGMTA